MNEVYNIGTWVAIPNQEEVVLSASSVEFTTAEVTASRGPEQNVVFSPFSWYANGKTYFTANGGSNTTDYMEGWIWEYDSNQGVKKPVLVQYPFTDDEHARNMIITDSDGYIHAFFTNVHNAPLIHMKSVYPNDTSAFNRQTNIGTNTAYANVRRIGSDGFIWTRQGGDYNLCYLESIGSLDNWGSEVSVTSSSGLAANLRHYPVLPKRWRQGGKEFLMGVRRYGTTPSYWADVFLLTTEDRVTFTNFDGSFSRNINTEGLITDAELDNYAIQILGSTGQSKVPAATMDESGTLYTILGNGSGGYHLRIVDTVNGTNTTKPITITNLTANAEAGFNEMNNMFFEFRFLNNVLECYPLINEGGLGTQFKIHRFTSSDFGDTWIDQGAVFADTSGGDGDFAVNFPLNIEDIPNDTNFSFATRQFNLADKFSNQPVHVKTAANGTIQSQSSSIITPYADINTAIAWDRAYQLKDGLFTRSGNTITELTDQSANGLHAVPSGSPQWDGVDSVDLDGVNDKFEIPVTGINTMTSGTIIMVLEKKSSQTVTAGVRALSFRNTGSNSFLACLGLANNTSNEKVSEINYVNFAANQYKVFGSVDYTDQKVILVFSLDSVYGRMYINDVLEDRILITGTKLHSYKWANDFSCNAITIGAFDTSFYDFSLSGLWIKSGNPLNEEERRRCIKTLADEYTVTLNDPYRR